MNGRQWTKVEDNLLCDLSDKVPVRQLMLLLGRTECSVRARIRRLNLRAQKVGENHHRAKISNLKAGMVGALYDAGYTPMEIYRFFTEPTDISYNYIQEICQCRARVYDVSRAAERYTK